MIKRPLDGSRRLAAMTVFRTPDVTSADVETRAEEPDIRVENPLLSCWDWHGFDAVAKIAELPDHFIGATLP